MQVKEVSYKRIFNLGNYESAQVELRAALDDGDDPLLAIDKLAAEAKAWRKSKDAPQQA